LACAPPPHTPTPPASTKTDVLRNIKSVQFVVLDFFLLLRCWPLYFEFFYSQVSFETLLTLTRCGFSTHLLLFGLLQHNMTSAVLFYFFFGSGAPAHRFFFFFVVPLPDKLPWFFTLFRPQDIVQTEHFNEIEILYPAQPRCHPVRDQVSSFSVQ